MSQQLRDRLAASAEVPAGIQRYNYIRSLAREVAGHPVTGSQADFVEMIDERIKQLEFEEEPSFDVNVQQFAEQAQAHWDAGYVDPDALEVELGDALSNETQYDQEEFILELWRATSQTDSAIAESEALEINSVGDAYYLMMWAAEYAREDNVNVQLYVNKISKEIRGPGGVVLDEQFSRRDASAILITPDTTEAMIREKANEIILNAMFFYDGELRSDKRTDYEFRFVVFDDVDVDDIPVYVKAGEMNCLLQVVHDNIREHANGTKYYKVYERFVEMTKELGEKGFDIRRASVLKDLPIDFEFYDRHGVIYTSKSEIKNRDARNDIKKLRIFVENEHARIRNFEKSKDVFYCGDAERDEIEISEMYRDFEEIQDSNDRREIINEVTRRIEDRNKARLLRFGEYYGLDIVAKHSQYPFVIGDSVILKTYRGDDITPTSENVALFMNSMKKKAGANVKMMNYEKYWKRARFTPITYRSTNWTPKLHHKVDGARMHLQALEKVRIPRDKLEHYNLDLTEKETREVVDKLRGTDESAPRIYGFAYCHYDEFPGAFRRIWRKEGVYEINIINMLAAEGIYPTNMRYIAMTRKYYDSSNYDMSFCRRLPKGQFNSMIGGLFKRRRVKTQAINCAQDYRLFLAHLKEKGYKIVSERKTGVKCPLDSNERSHADGDLKKLFLNFDFTPFPKKAEKYFEQRIIEYKVPKTEEYKVHGLPVLQTAITNLVAFTMCKLENYFVSEGYKVAGVWGDGLTYEKDVRVPDLRKIQELTGFTFKFENIPDDCEHLVKTVDLRQRVREFLPLESSVPTKFIYDIETVLDLQDMLLEGPGGSGKTHFLKSLTAELENVIITSSKQKTARDIGGSTVHKLCCYFPSFKDDQVQSAKVKEVGKWSVHSVKRAGYDSDYAIQQASYIVLDECYVSPTECTDKVIESEALIFYTGDKLQKGLIGEKIYDLPEKYEQIGRPLRVIDFNANMRFKTLDNQPHVAHFEMLNDLRQYIGTEQDPELIPVDPKNPARALMIKNRKGREFVSNWIKKYNLKSEKYNVANARRKVEAIGKDNVTILTSTNDFSESWNSIIEPKIQIGSKVITHSCKENGIIATVDEFCGGKNSGTDSEQVLLSTGKKIALRCVRLAYSMTIDKSQGSTFEDSVIVDCRNIKDLRSFYVALSRCRYPDNMALFV